MRFPVAVLLVLLIWRVTSAAQVTNEVEAIRREMEQMRLDYEKRLLQLEQRLRTLEKDSSVATPLPEPTSTAPLISDRQTTNASDVFLPAAATTNATQTDISGRYRDRQVTESRQRAIADRQETALRERVEQVLESFVDISGYFRAGYGISEEGAPQSAFQAPGAFSKYRLGNEAELYGELGFGKDFYLPKLFSMDQEERPLTTQTSPVARVELLISAYNPYQDALTASGTDLGLPEAWASIANVVPGQRDLRFWAGARYYRRHDIHISDFYFYNMSGAGGGVEDITLPFGKVAVAWIGLGSRSGFTDVPQPDPENEAGFSKDGFDFRLYDVKVPLGKAEFGIALSRSDSGSDALGNSVPESRGIAFNALHTRDKFLSYDGFNKFSLQFGTGPAKTFTSGYETLTLDNGVFIRPDAENSWRFRVTEHFIANLGTRFSLSPAVVYQLTDYGDEGGMHQWASAGVRPILHFNRYLSLALETGVDWVDDEEAGTSGQLTKITLAPQVSLGRRFLSRPVIRAYVTYSFWSDDFVGRVGGADYQNSDHGWSYGIQMEAWW